MARTLKPLSDNVLVKRFKNESITSGGIHVPETAQGKTQTGQIVAIGEGKIMKDGSIATPKVREGQIVLFGKYSGTDVEIDGEEFLMLKESDLLGVYQEDCNTNACSKQAQL